MLSKNSIVTAYFDVDWTGNMDDGISTSAESNARSCHEAEHRALAATTSEITWLWSSLFRELRIPYSEPPLILSDNIGATQLSLNPVHHHSYMKHIAVDYILFVIMLQKDYWILVMFHHMIDWQKLILDLFLKCSDRRSASPMVRRSCKGMLRNLLQIFVHLQRPLRQQDHRIVTTEVSTLIYMKITSSQFKGSQH